MALWEEQARAGETGCVGGLHACLEVGHAAVGT